MFNEIELITRKIIPMKNFELVIRTVTSFCVTRFCNSIIPNLKIWQSILCILAVSSVICQPIHLFNDLFRLQKYQKMYNEKIYLREKLVVTIVYFCYGHASPKRESIFHWITIFMSLLTLLMSRKINLKLQAYQKFKRI